MNPQNWLALGLAISILALGFALIPLNERLERRRRWRERHQAHRRKR